MENLQLYNGDATIVTSAATVLAIAKAIIAAGPEKEAEFLQAVRGFDRAIEITDPALVNLVKTYLHTNRLHEESPAMLTVTKSPPGSTSCFPKR